MTLVKSASCRSLTATPRRSATLSTSPESRMLHRSFSSVKNSMLPMWRMAATSFQMEEIASSEKSSVLKAVITVL